MHALSQHACMQTTTHISKPTSMQKALAMSFCQNSWDQRQTPSWWKLAFNKIANQMQSFSNQLTRRKQVNNLLFSMQSEKFQVWNLETKSDWASTRLKMDRITTDQLAATWTKISVEINAYPHRAERYISMSPGACSNSSSEKKKIAILTLW